MMMTPNEITKSLEELKNHGAIAFYDAWMKGDTEDIVFSLEAMKKTVREVESCLKEQLYLRVKGKVWPNPLFPRAAAKGEQG